MKTTTLVRTGLVLATFCLFSAKTLAIMPTHPESDRDFHRLPDGKDIRNLSVRGSKLRLTRGSGSAFSSSKKAAYLKLKDASKRDPKYAVQWSLMDLDSGQVIDQSAGANRKMFGASSSKIFVGGALLDRQNGNLSSSQLNQMAAMLVVSDNGAWVSLQSQIGGGSAEKGRQLNYEFTQRLGLEQTRGFQGYWGKMHGNELTAAETTEYLHNVYKGNFPGAEVLWKLMYTCRTGAAKGNRYLPSSQYIGGKTGTYSGSTEDPETGRTVNVRSRNHAVTFNVGGRQYGLTVLANTGADEHVALMVGGLYAELTNH